MSFETFRTLKFVSYGGVVEWGDTDHEHSELLERIVKQRGEKIDVESGEEVVEALLASGGDMGRFYVDAKPTDSQKGLILIQSGSNSRRYNFPPEEDRVMAERIRAETRQVFERFFPEYRCELETDDNE